MTDEPTGSSERTTGLLLAYDLYCDPNVFKDGMCDYYKCVIITVWTANAPVCIQGIQIKNHLIHMEENFRFQRCQSSVSLMLLL